jgi:AmmeMemoRadiSam system protein A
MPQATGNRPQAESQEKKDNGPVASNSGLKSKTREGGMAEYTLNNEEKKTLLKIARETLENHLQGKKVPEFKAGSPALQEKRGAFVTLKEHGRLRGCIGRIVGDTPVYKVVSEFAIYAATEDNRFPQVEYGELKDIEIEISVLTPFDRIKSFDEIEIGKHGLIIKKDFRQGLFLPQVPVEQGWDMKTYLEELCHKAGLPADAYKDKDAIIEKFRAIVFSESEMR